jgi:hypothetical protein
VAIRVPIVTQFDASGLTQAQSRLERAGAGFRRAALPIAAAGGAVIGVGTALIRAGEEASTANARISSIAEQMNLFGEDTETVSRRLVQMAEDLGMATGMSPTDLKQAQATLLTFSEIAESADVAGGAFDRATQAAADLAAAGFGSAETNAVSLGRALQDPLRGLSALGRQGVTFTQEQQDLIASLVETNDMLGAQDIILQAIEGQVGGTAAATADASARMGVAFQLIMQRLGEKLLPAFERFVDYVIDTVIPAVEEFGGKLRDWWATYGPGITAFVGNIVELFRKIVEHPIFGAVLGAAVDSFVGMVREGFNVVKGIVDTLIALLDGDFSAAWDGIKLTIGSVVRFMNERLFGIPGAIAGVFASIGRTVMDAFGTAYNAFAKVWNSTVGGIGFTVPRQIPGIGGARVAIPTLPTYQGGGGGYTPTPLDPGRREGPLRTPSGKEETFGLSRSQPSVQIHVDMSGAVMFDNAQEIANTMVDAINSSARQNGYVDVIGSF